MNNRGPCALPMELRLIVLTDWSTMMIFFVSMKCQKDVNIVR